MSPEMLPLTWPQVLPWIEGACARVPSELSPDDLYGICERGEGALMLIGEPGEPPIAAGVSQVRDHQDGTRTAWVLALGGSGGRGVWRYAIDAIETGARRIGCKSINFVGRPGWAAIMPDYACSVSYRKDLN